MLMLLSGCSGGEGVTLNPSPSRRRPRLRPRRPPAGASASASASASARTLRRASASASAGASAGASTGPSAAAAEPQWTGRAAQQHDLHRARSCHG